MAGLSDILSTLQNGVTAVSALNKTLAQVFPGYTAVGVVAPSSTGNTLTYLSSQPKGWISVTTSSGFAGKVPIY